jgi:ubiquinone/menaquinone biosynthesis C-methylase UbiE
MTDRSSRDIYARITEVPDEDLQRIATVLEIRGRHPQQVRIRSTYLDAAPGWTGARVLEVGCGTGVVSRDLARRVGSGGSVMGVDPSPWLLREAERLARAEYLTNLEFTRGDARDLDLPSASFDAAVAHTVLCHVPDAPALIAELARVTRPGGHLILFDGDYAANTINHPDGPTTERIVAAWLENVVHDSRIMRRAPELFRRAGLELVRFDGHVHVECGTVPEDTSFIWTWALFALQQARTHGAVTEEEGGAWLSGLRGLNEREELFGSVTYYSAVVRRPEGHRGDRCAK